MRHFYVRRQGGRQEKNCPTCRREMEIKHILLYHRHPVPSYGIPEYNSCLNKAIELLSSHEDTCVLYDPSLGVHDMHVVQTVLSSHQITSAICYGSPYEHQRTLKQFYDEDHPLRVLITNHVPSYTIHTQHVILLRDTDTNWNALRGRIQALDQVYERITVHTLSSEDVEFNHV